MFTFFINSEAQTGPLALASTSGCSGSRWKDVTGLGCGVSWQREALEARDQPSCTAVERLLLGGYRPRMHLVINNRVAVVRNSGNHCYYSSPLIKHQLYTRH